MHSSVPGRSLIAIALTVAAFAAGSSPAAASTVSLAGDTLTYTAAPGEVNDLTLSKWDDTIRLSDKKIKITAGAGCTLVKKTVTCTGATLSTTVVVDLGDMNDHVRLGYVSARTNDDWATSFVTGGDGKDVLRGGDADDTIEGGDGNDYITGNFGDDHLLGGDGDDKLFGGFGDDLLEGGPGTDLLQGTAGNDILIQD